jgi:predicted dehydrogenase
MATIPALSDLDYRPSIPETYRPKIGIIGVGGIVKQSHLPAYKQYGVEVAAVYDINPEATAGVLEAFGVGRVASSLDDFLGDQTIEIVDIATFPAQRVELIKQALDAGKHVLSQKPLALDLPTAIELVEHADRAGLKLAVNQNGRWAPSWRIATQLIERGTIGELISVTHTLDRSYRWTIGTHFEKISHWAIYDYTVHWIDITRCWMGNRPASRAQGHDFRTPNQPEESLTPWGLLVEIDYEDGASAVIRGTGGEPSKQEGHPFLINGTEGKIRGSVLGNDFVELEVGETTTKYQFDGAWFPDGFAGAMGELISAIAEDRNPSNSARHNLMSLQLTLAAVASADNDGAPMTIERDLSGS